MQKLTMIGESVKADLGNTRLKICIQGAVQGVGFRPHVFRLAQEMRLAGWVNNSAQGVSIEAEGCREALERFLFRLEQEKPALSVIQRLESTWLDSAGYRGFEIRGSDSAGAKSVLVMPDIATCPDCLREMFDPTDRRFRYPFTNCTHCGPRFSIIESVPYDRANTSMRGFVMCPACQWEYDDPRNRRFHAQPNACPVCGPQLELWNVGGEAVFGGDDALRAVAQMIRRGQVVAVKGVGGFHLLVDARNENAVRRLRERKRREEKPFALMFPSIEAIRKTCEVSALEESLLGSPEAPIVLLRKRLGQTELTDLVAPRNPNLGVMLPSNPIQHVLMAELGFPVVATSGNLSEEPICTDESEAVEQLGGIADGWLVHNRPIVRQVDDSIVREMLGQPMMLRRARGYAPLPIRLSLDALETNPPVVLAVGAHLKNSVALEVEANVFLSQHIGDLETLKAHAAFSRVAADLPAFYEAEPQILAADLHPDYVSTRHACNTGKRVVGVQHHLAHVFSCLAENNVALPALGVAWDGMGLGWDGSIWGGEFFQVTDQTNERVAHLRPFPLPGGDQAAREPRRVALGVLYELFGDAAFEMKGLAPIDAFSNVEFANLKQILRRKINCPACCSVGRFFDAVASLLKLRQRAAFEGQAAMTLEFACEPDVSESGYQFVINDLQTPWVLDWAPVIVGVLADLEAGLPAGVITTRVHQALIEAIVEIACRTGAERVALSGGCFQNRQLLERTVTRLRSKNIQAHWHHRVPTNDGGIALGQVYGARRILKGS